MFKVFTLSNQVAPHPQSLNTDSSGHGYRCIGGPRLCNIWVH